MEIAAKIYGTTLYVGTIPIQTVYGEFQLHTFQNLIHKGYIMALAKGDLGAERLYTRIHSSCVTSETLRSLDCDCVLQLEGALRQISAKGAGILFYMIQEGRGCGYIGKSRACMHVQYHEDRISTFDAYRELGMRADYREYDNIAEVAHMLGVSNSPFVLMTNNPDKIKGFQDAGLKLEGVESIEAPPSPFNQSYLVSKQKMGHLLYQTKKKQSRYHLPYPLVKPFEPYSLDQYSRFVHCSTYYLPIKPVRRQMVVTRQELATVAHDHQVVGDIDADRLLVKFSDDKALAEIGIRPYWFKVHMYYDLASDRDFVVLTYGDLQAKTPLVRVHSESLLNRFPLVHSENHYKEKYLMSLEQIVRNDSGLIVLLYKDGRGSGLSNLVLSHVFGKDRTGIQVDVRDYVGASQLIHHHVGDQEIRVLYSGSSRVPLNQALVDEHVQVSDWVELYPKDDQKGHEVIDRRIRDLPQHLIPMRNNPIRFNYDHEYLVTGVGVSEAHARYFVHQAKKYHPQLNIRFVPTTAIVFGQIQHPAYLVAISQGLSPTIMAAAASWPPDKLTLITAVTDSNPDAGKRDLVAKVLRQKGEVINFPVEDEYTTLIRVIGPAAGFFCIYQLVQQRSLEANFLAQLHRTLLDAAHTKLPEAFAENLPDIEQVVILAAYPATEYLQNLKFKLIEGAFIPAVHICDYLEFPHGLYQNCEHQRARGKLCYVVMLEGQDSATQQAAARTRELLGPEYPVWRIMSQLPVDLQVLEFEMIFNHFVMQAIEAKDIDQVTWQGKDRQHLLYDWQPAVIDAEHSLL